MTDSTEADETDGRTERDDSTQWVVYSMSHLGGTGRFLGVADSSEEAREIGDMWWKAFHSGAKEEPADYAGVSWSPVADFDEWNSPEEMGGRNA